MHLIPWFGFSVQAVKTRKIEAAVRDLALLLGPPSFRSGSRRGWPLRGATETDVAAWQSATWYGSVPVFIGLLGLWISVRVVVQAVPTSSRAGRPVSVPPLVRRCWYVQLAASQVWSSLLRSFVVFFGGFEMCLPCGIGADHCRLRHLRWEHCGDGFSSRPGESAGLAVHFALLGILDYP